MESDTFTNPQSQAQPQQPIIIVVNSGAGQRQHNAKAAKVSVDSRIIKGLSITEAVLCGLSVLTQLVSYFLNIRYYRVGINYFAGSGFWCGIFFGLAAGFGLMAARKKTGGSIICLMVLSILAATLSFPYFIITTIDVSGVAYGGSRILAAIHVLIALTGGIIAICLSAYSCKAICCRNYSTGVVHYNAAGASNADSMTLDQVQQLTGIRIPLANPAVAAGASAATPPFDAESLPPKYDNIDLEQGDRYQRFQ